MAAIDVMAAMDSGTAVLTPMKEVPYAIQDN